MVVETIRGPFCPKKAPGSKWGHFLYEKGSVHFFYKARRLFHVVPSRSVIAIVS